MTILQLSPPIPMESPKGDGLAYALIDYGVDYDLMWVVAITETGEIWTFKNPEVRAIKNITIGRVYDRQ
jgi:hypothetical protein